MAVPHLPRALRDGFSRHALLPVHRVEVPAVQARGALERRNSLNRREIREKLVKRGLWTLQVRCTVVKTIRCEGTEEEVTEDPFEGEEDGEKRELGFEILSVKLEEEGE